MEIKNTGDAYSFIQAWTVQGPKDFSWCGAKAQANAIAAAVKGCETALGIMESAAYRYSEAERSDMRAAIATLRDALRA